MVYDRERFAREDAVYAEHKKAVAGGEKRVLRKTSTGELHSYPADEIGFTPGSGQPQVSSWWGMGIIMVFMILLLATGAWLFQRPLWEGNPPEWGALWLIGFAGLMTLYAFNLARDEYRATRLRKLRGSPKPSSSGQVDINLLELGQKRPDQPGDSR
ncbi:conserved hypothetical protein (plasmid) [Pseudarthrobacter chlorophenolicus A6]|uniref:Uncharacterized protein n=1 Tax=Pseudarthrobacter chlorophenolicus (strain ATCC 700700 / DSM 12829 / CIP 107037 / JCM 12360 / KCTC 9906 / NCIMB 13794 / A6) TaxID=452863 RepID=B8HHN0_PSECP|nr:hypothetical protein [Pseudarthrobacter chlorophenolicus]ACL41927.1 conserved hypothetical protein [Pseudarthrobacter chlorophenolicus A6]SDQ18791.1 hypothetical protein SAMN04489738_0587 [Pseudarthrobacter chlorophenolicus]